MATLKGAAYQKLPFELFPQHVDRENFLEKLGLDIPKSLTQKELNVLKHLVSGKSASKIADQLLISSRTVEHLLERIKDKLDCSNKAELIQKIHNLDSFGYLNLHDA